MGVLIRVFIPETGLKTQLIHDDLQNIREWTLRHTKDTLSVRIKSNSKIQTQCMFLKEALDVFGSWKNVSIH